MSNLQVKVVNAETGEEIIRDANADELAQFEQDAVQEDFLNKQAAEAAAKRQALLDKLGITEDEAKLLLGGN